MKRRKAGGLPPVAVLEVLEVDEDSIALARPSRMTEEASRPRIRVLPDNRAGGAVAAGDRILARIERTGRNSYEARAMRRLPRERDRGVVGIYRRIGRDGRLDPTDRRVRTAYAIAGRDSMGARHGELVRAETRPGRRPGLPHARIVERLGKSSPVAAASAIAIAEHGIPDRFSDETVAEAEAAVATPLGEREELRDIPLVTIDDETARDFDDAVWAASDPDGGFRLIVAIADVARYVRPGSRLDAAARERGNSVYFRTASCRCCRKPCPAAGARSSRARTGPASRYTSGSTRRAG